jgi:PIF1 helicase.
MIPTDMLFEFKRIQFPIRVAFAMTINKSQGQTLSVCGLNQEYS